ncbi:MAG TPA: hypothetical protein PKW33_09080 [Anaerolineaceae bacterium]|nr:hypothetical protein [Anaerolineaceae bacterium]HPN51728.1 hypothetical protein [Anaerolineaceae bacterium]
MKKPLFWIFCFMLFFLFGCNLSQPAVITPDPAAVETQVSVLQTQQSVPQPSTDTQANPTQVSASPAAPIAAATAVPTATPQLSSTPTSLPSATPQPSLTPEPTLTATAVPPTWTPTPISGDPRAVLGDPSFQDTFDKDKNSWGFSEDETKGEVANGVYALTAINDNGYYGWRMNLRKPKNFYLEATIRTSSCSGSDRYGLIIRAPGYDDGYFYGITCEGKMSFEQWSSDSTILNWTKIPVGFNAGSNQTNRIGIKAEGSHFTFYINGVKAGECDDTALTDEGMFGFFIASSNTPNFTIYIEEVAYWLFSTP